MDFTLKKKFTLGECRQRKEPWKKSKAARFDMLREILVNGNVKK